MRQLPRIRIAHLPTPIEPMPQLSAYLGGVKIFIKRDDQTGLAFGGNKTRKLEYLLADAQSHGAKTLLTAGAGQSNHCRQTAAAASKYGLDCTLVLSGTPSEYSSGNLLLDELLGAEIVWTELDRRDQVLTDEFNRLWKQGKRPYKIPYGGSNGVGASAYAFAIKELINQIKNEPINGLAPDYIIFPTSSGGTQAGLVVGKSIFSFPGTILGISVDKQESVLKSIVSKLVIDITDKLAVSQMDHSLDDNIVVNANYLGDGYGRVNQQVKEAVKLFAQKEGILLDPVYTGKAAAGLIDLINTHQIPKNESILFWHTGGTPALFASQYRNLWN